MMAVLLAVTAGAGYVGAALVARHRAQAAADLAALAAATEIPAGVGVACAKASAIARAMETTVTACTADALDVVVTVEARVSLEWVGNPARAVARAGPVA